ncbi:MAG TPA: flagellar hook-basal body complex protein FliE [Steroidobacteraceae bacterium]|nr:flagellar hook-basal body complex protein FliE [Steroidobacteraceae bacterium]
MSNMQVNSVLAQIRSLSSQVHSVSNSVGALSPSALKAQQAEPGSFASLLKDGVAQVNQAQVQASDLATKFERGVPGVELSDVMLEMQKANVSFRALTEVRNRFVNVYQEIMNMPI